MIIKIISSGPGKQCDLYSFGSIHEGQYDEKGFKLRGKDDYIPAEFEKKELNELPKKWYKRCPHCVNTFETDHPFVDSRQNDEEPICVRCYERKYIIGRDSYREALKAEILAEIALNNVAQPPQ